MDGTQNGKHYTFAHPQSYLGDPNVAHVHGWDLVCCVPRESIGKGDNNGLVVYRRASWPRRLWRRMLHTNFSRWFDKKPPF